MKTCKHIVIVVAALSLFGCKEDLPPESLELLDLNIYSVAFQSQADNPYDGVSFIRIAVTDVDDNMVADKFVHYEPGSAKPLEAIPFGDDLKITIEGWSQNAQGLIGQLISRGKSSRFTMHEDTDPQTVGVMVSKVNAFARTSKRTESGSQATNLNTGRVGHTVTMLANGQVLIVGGARLTTTGDYTKPGDLGEVFASVEIYDPNTGEYAEFPQGLTTARAFHTAKTLSDGRVVVAGGMGDTSGTTLSTIEIFDPSSGGAFELIPGATLNTGRAGHTVNIVEGGDHLVFAGGFTVQGGTVSALGTIEVMCLPGSPCEGSGLGVIYTGNMKEPRYFHTANRAPSGPQDLASVVLIGGEGDEGVRDTLETFILNPARVEDKIGTMTGGGRTRHTATYVDSQRFIHVVGGFDNKEHLAGVQRIDSYQVTQQAFQGGQEFYALHARGGHAAVVMPGNAVLLFGGFNDGLPLSSAEVIFEYYDEASNQTFIDRGGVSPMSAGRGGCAGILLQNDTVLAVGGMGASGQMNTVSEFFNPL